MDQRERYLVIGFATLMVLAAVWYWILPMYNRYGSLKSKIKSNVEKVRSAQVQAAQLKKLVKELKTTKRELKTVKQKLPESGRFNQLMSTLEQHARDAGIPDRKIIEFNRSNVKKLEGGLLREMTIQTRFKDITMVQLTDMLWRFDQMTRMVDIKNYNNSNMTLGQNENQVQFDINLTLSVYMLEEDTKNDSSGESA